MSEPTDERVWDARDVRQTAVFRWAKDTFGEDCSVPEERARRFFEEAVELVQALGIPQYALQPVIDHVYARAPGQTAQELGGVGVTLLALAQSLGLSADREEAAEFARVSLVDAATFRERHNRKADAGIAARAPGTGAERND